MRLGRLKTREGFQFCIRYCHGIGTVGSNLMSGVDIGKGRT